MENYIEVFKTTENELVSKKPAAKRLRRSYKFWLGNITLHNQRWSKSIHGESGGIRLESAKLTLFDQTYARTSVITGRPFLFKVTRDTGGERERSELIIVFANSSPEACKYLAKEGFCDCVEFLDVEMVIANVFAEDVTILEI
jgi:hypothetical protein